MPTMTKVKALFGDRMVDAYEFTGEWLKVSDGYRPLEGNRKILIPYLGIVWIAARDPMDGYRWNLAESSQIRRDSEIEYWMPVPEPPEGLGPFDFDDKPRSMTINDD